MTTVVALLRGVNVGGHNQIKMDALRTICESLSLQDPQTYVQSGNVVFRTRERDLAAVGKRIEDCIERKFGFRPGVILRTTSEMKDVIARNPLAKRRAIEPAKLYVTFLASQPAAEVQDAILAVKTAGEEVRVDGRELYIYFPNGMGRSKLMPVVERLLKKSGTSRNWNTVTKLLEMAEQLEK